MCEQINETNCVDILNLVDLFSIKDIKNEIDMFILRNFEKLIQNEHYKKLKFDQLCFYVASNKLKCYPEVKVFTACVNWWRFHHHHHNHHHYKLSNNSSHGITANNTVFGEVAAKGAKNKSIGSSFYELARLIRFHTMKPEEFINVVTKNELMKQDPQCQELLIQGFDFFFK